MSKDGRSRRRRLAESEVRAQKAGIDLERLRQSVKSAERATEAQLEGLRLDFAVLEKEAAEARHRLEPSTTRADQDGVLTSVVTEEEPRCGAETCSRGRAARRVPRRGPISDVHAVRLVARPAGPRTRRGGSARRNARERLPENRERRRALRGLARGPRRTGRFERTCGSTSWW
mgnify:CR=1 FL=1